MLRDRFQRVEVTVGKAIAHPGNFSPRDAALGREQVGVEFPKFRVESGQGRTVSPRRASRSADRHRHPAIVAARHATEQAEHRDARLGPGIANPIGVIPHAPSQRASGSALERARVNPRASSIAERHREHCWTSAGPLSGRPARRGSSYRWSGSLRGGIGVSGVSTVVVTTRAPSRRNIGGGPDSSRRTRVARKLKLSCRASS